VIVGLNVPWATDEPGTDPYPLYGNRFAQAADLGVNVVRVWAAPWEVAFGTTFTEYIANRVRHFSRLSDLAAAHGLKLIVVAQSHVEFLAGNARSEVADDQHAWAGNPLCRSNGGVHQRPRQYFESDIGRALSTQYLRAVGVAVESDCLFQLELVNEIDRISGLRTAVMSDWFEVMRSELLDLIDPDLVTLSCADPFMSLKVAKRAAIRTVGVHIYGWPSPNPYKSIAIVEAEFERSAQDFLVTELGLDSQRPPDDREVGLWIGALCRPMFGPSMSPALPWWPETVLDDGLVTETYRSVVCVLNGHDGLVELGVRTAGLGARDSILTRIRERSYLLWSASSWARAARNALHLVANRRVDCEGPWLRTVGNYAVTLTPAALRGISVDQAGQNGGDYANRDW
jgi:hypothetical protein